MKKLIMMMLMAIAHPSFSQCTIIGDDKISNLKESDFETTLEAPCKDCYQWSIEGNPDMVIQSKTKRISLKGIKAGSFKIKVAALTPKGLVSCEKNFEVIENEVINSASDGKIKSSNCNITNIDFKEVHFSDNQFILYPAETPLDISYSWEVTFKNGKKLNLTEKAPKVSNEEENPITEVVMIWDSKVCTKKYTKNYPESFWDQFKEK